MYEIKQSTAITVPVFAHDVNGDAVAGKVDGDFTKRISKNGGAFAAMTVAITEMENGWYSVPLSSAHTDTLGVLSITFTAGGVKQINLQFRVAARITDDLAFPATSGRSMVVDAAGLVDANTVKLGPTGAGTAQTAKDVGLAVPAAAAGASGGLLISGANAGTTTLGALTITGATTHTGNVVLSDGLTISAPSTLNRAGLDIIGNGTGAAIKLAAGATGKGIAITTTAGDGLSILPTGGHGIVATANGTNMHGAVITGGTAGVSDGMKLVAGTGGVDLRANQTGNLTGNVSGSVGSVTGAVGSVTGAVGSVTGAVGSVTANVNAVLTNGAHGGAAATLQLGGAGGLTGNITGNLTGSVGSVTGAVGSVTGSVGSVTGAVGSVTGNVGGNVAGSVGSVTAAVTVGTNNDKTGYTLSAAGVTAIWAEVMTGTTTAVQAVRGFIAAMLGKASGLDTLAPKYRNIADTKDVISATTDANGNRSAVTLDLT